MIEDGFNDDTLAYYYKRLDCSSSGCDSENYDDVASHDMNNKVFDEGIIENRHAPCTKFYDEYFNVTTNPFADCEESLKDFGLVSDPNIDDICEYKSD